LDKFRKWIILLIAAVGLLIMTVFYGDHLLCRLNYSSFLEKFSLEERIDIPFIVSSQDQNENGISDVLDIVNGAREEVEQGTQYDGSYYQGGYPPEGKGACTDVIWRALKAADYNLKEMVDEDIQNAPAAYGETGSNPDPNIDFRRVRNLQIFFERHGQELTTEVKPGDVDNLIYWQAGDIIVFGPPLEHIGIISDRRRRDGVPFVIHNAGPRATEGDYLLHWPSEIVHHFRFITDKD